MDRRGFLGIGGAAVAGTLVGADSAMAAGLGKDVSKIEAALARFRDLPGPTSYSFQVGHPASLWSAEHKPDDQLFVGSAMKVFYNLKYLQDVERGRLDLNTRYKVSNKVRSLSSSVLIDMAGTMPARSLLEAMITHSDNTATDIVLGAVGPDRVRKFFSRYGYDSAKIPDSTRLMFSYLAGAPYGVDKGWKGMQRIMEDKFFGKPRSPLNNRVTFKCSASDMVKFYTRALDGKYFRDAATLTEFKRIQAMADAISRIVPAGTAAYAKGGSVEWLDFNTLCVPGQMVVGGKLPVTFCFTVNWDGPASTIPGVQTEFTLAVRDALQETVNVFG